jgi:hypothetical protein
MAAEASGGFYWIAGGTVYRRSRSQNQTQVFASGYGPLRGAVIAAASGLENDGSPWSLYVAEGSNPTKIVELPGVAAPASLIAADQGPHPGRGARVNVTYGFQVLDLTVDQQGRLLLVGTNYGATTIHYLKRLQAIPTPTLTTLASSANGLVGPLEGVCLAPDHSLYTLARGGTIQHVTLGPLSISTLFTDPANQITAAKDLALDVDGSFYVATREAWDLGKIMKVAGGSASLLSFTEETRGLAANPAGGMYISQWRNQGFAGTVDLFHFANNTIQTLSGFSGLNFSNEDGRGDGKICVDVDGTVFATAMDCWSAVRYHPNLNGFERIGTGYTRYLSGLAIGISTPSSGSTTGWSLYVSDFDNLYEFPSSRPPASTLVDATLGLTMDRGVVATPHPRYGKPGVLARQPSPTGAWIGTEEGWLLSVDTTTGAVTEVAGPAHGLRGRVLAIVSSADGSRTFVLNDRGEIFLRTARGLRELALDPATSARALERAKELSKRAYATGPGTWLVLEDWAIVRWSPRR